MSTVKQKLNEEIGFPVLSDGDSVELFVKLFNQEVSKYQPSLKGRNCYSFQLKQAPNKTITTKVLK
jgi:hypothetical protein